MKVSKTRKRSPRISKIINIPKDYHWKCLGAFVGDIKAYLSEDEVEEIRTIIRNRDFVEYLKLDDKWGLRSINSLYNANFEKSKARYAVSSLLKKYLPEENPELDILATRKFLEAEECCKTFNSELVNYLLDGSIRYNREFLAYTRSFLKQLLGDQVPIRTVIDNAKHGPGANLDTQDGETDIFDKYLNFPYSCTQAVSSYAIYMIQSDHRWFRALKDHYIRVKSLSSDNEINMAAFWSYFIKIVDYNRITSVPKNAKISRTIAIEPALNIMLQLGTNEVIVRRLKRWGIDLNSQEFNRLLSRVGSKFGIFATIDLSSASDMIALQLCKALLPEEWYLFLLALRVPKGRVKIDGRYHTVKYEKISSMGNGYTFALESAIFAAVIYAAHKIKKQPLHFGSNAAVFGDDLIVRGDMYEEVMHGLEMCGFRINQDKSFNNGPIRESCGTDWFQGRYIRPLFFSKPPSDPLDLIVDYNLSKRFLETQFGITDSQLCLTILKWIPKDLQFLGPYSDEVFDSWIHSDKMPAINPDGYHFRRLLRIAKVRKFSNAELYGNRFFHFLSHNLKGPEKVRFYELKRIKVQKGCRFSVYSKEYTIRQKPVISSLWDTTYTVSLPLIS